MHARDLGLTFVGCSGEPFLPMRKRSTEGIYLAHVNQSKLNNPNIRLGDKVLCLNGNRVQGITRQEILNYFLENTTVTMYVRHEPLPDNYRVFTVAVQEAETLGFHITSYKDAIIVQNISPECQVKNIRVGTRILKIEEQCFTNIKLEKAKYILSTSKGRFSVAICKGIKPADVEMMDAAKMATSSAKSSRISNRKCQHLHQTQTQNCQQSTQRAEYAATTGIDQTVIKLKSLKINPDQGSNTKIATGFKPEPEPALANVRKKRESRSYHLGNEEETKREISKEFGVHSQLSNLETVAEGHVAAPPFGVPKGVTSIITGHRDVIRSLNSMWPTYMEVAAGGNVIATDLQIAMANTESTVIVLCQSINAMLKEIKNTDMREEIKQEIKEYVINAKKGHVKVLATLKHLF